MNERQLLRPAWAEVDLAAFRTNVETVANIVPDTTKVMPVIKANGYGIGATMAARAVQNLRKVAGFAVATPEEALALRDDGIDGTILVLGPCTHRAMALLAYRNISVAVASVHGLKDARSAARDVGVNLKIHLKIETGMGRVGIQPGHDLNSVIRELKEGSEVEVEGVFTHFSAADVDKAYTEKQFAAFTEALSQLEQSGIRPRYRHASNSAAILDFPESHLDMVRPGIVIYGSFPDESLEGRAEIRPVLSLYAQVTHVKTVPEGSTIGYGRTYTVESPTTIATIPIGYADGYPRLLSGKGEVLLSGKRYPIAGRVCMDQTMIDVGSDPVKPGDKVTLIGTDGSETITVDDVARLSQTIAHEVLTGLTSRVPRVYIS
jgi:alanine racemase